MLDGAAPLRVIDRRAAGVEVFVYSDVQPGLAREVADALKSAAGRPVTVRLNSAGGDASEGLGVYDQLCGYSGRVTTVIEGWALSIASVIAQAGVERRMTANSFLMIHLPHSVTAGDANQHDNTAGLLRKFGDRLAAIYAARTGQPLDRIAGMMASETWMNATEALAGGFIDKIDEPADVAASFDTPRFRNVPPAVMAALERGSARGGKVDAITNDPVETAQVANVEVAAINAAWRAARQLDLIAECEGLLDAGTDPGDVPALLIEAHARRAHSVSATQRVFPSGGVSVGRSHDDPAAIRGRMVAALVARATGSAPPDAAREYRGAPLAEMIRILAAARGEHTGSWTVADAIDYGIRCASPLTTSDLPGLLQGTGQRILDAAFAAASSAFVQVARTLEVPDFRSFDVLRRGEWPSLQPVLESGEVTYGPVAEEKETLKVATYARNLGLSRASLINDDLQVFTNPARDAGQAAAEAVASKIVSELALNSGSGPNLSDGNPVFTNSRGNKASSGAAISNTSLGAARQAIRTFKSVDGVTIPQGDPQYLICGPAKETTAESILSALVIPYQATDLTPGSLRALRLLIEPRLGTGAQWYVFCSPSDRPTLNIATLNGRSTPQLQTFEEAGYLGTTFRVVFDFVVGFSDWRGAFLNAGA